MPYFGQPFLPAFGRDQHGLDNINLPFLGISGTADTTAPIGETEIGMSLLTGTRELVALSGVTHGFDNASTNDILTWTLTFLDAEVRGNPATQQQLSTMASVAGGGDDSVVIFYNDPPGAPAPTAVVQPLPLPGPHAVACSNVLQDFSRVGAGVDVKSYWEGMPSANGPR